MSDPTATCRACGKEPSFQCREHFVMEIEALRSERDGLRSELADEQERHQGTLSLLDGHDTAFAKVMDERDAALKERDGLREQLAAELARHRTFIMEQVGLLKEERERADTLRAQLDQTRADLHAASLQSHVYHHDSHARVEEMAAELDQAMAECERLREALRRVDAEFYPHEATLRTVGSAEKVKRIVSEALSPAAQPIPRDAVCRHSFAAGTCLTCAQPVDELTAEAQRLGMYSCSIYGETKHDPTLCPGCTGKGAEQVTFDAKREAKELTALAWTGIRSREAEEARIEAALTKAEAEGFRRGVEAAAGLIEAGSAMAGRAKALVAKIRKLGGEKGEG